VMALSAYMPSVDGLASQRHTANQQTPIFVAHGTQDPVVGLAMGQQAVDWLQQHAYPVKWHQYPMQHQVCFEQIQQIGVWLRQVLR